jgi:hypothetical protein
MYLNGRFYYTSFSLYHYRYYNCSINQASITKEGMTISPIVGEHEQSKSNQDVESVNFFRTTVEYFPRGLVNYFPNLKALDIENCGLKMICREDLEGLENLEILVLRNNKLRSLPTDLFIGMKKLRVINCYNNMLECLSPKLLEPLVGHLEVVDFRNNTNIDKRFEMLRSALELEKLMLAIKEQENRQQFAEQALLSMAAMWESGRFSDFTIVAGAAESSKEFKVHTFVLAQSEVFAAAFTHEMKEKQEKKMIIDDFSADVVEEMLRFIYTGKVKDESVATAIDLFSLAARFDFKLLKEKAEKILIKNVDESSAYQVYMLGHLHNCEVMKLAAFNVVKKMFPDRKISDSLMNNPESIKNLVDLHKRIHEALAAVEPENQKKKMKRAE